MGGVILDQYLVVEDYPVRGQDAVITDSFDRVGGCALNVAYTLKNLGCDPYITATLGKDDRGGRIYEYLRSRGFRTDCVRLDGEAQSGYCSIIVDGSGERTFLTYRGCEAAFSSGMVGDGIAARISFVYLTGYYLLDPRYYGDILFILKKLKARGSRILFDPGPLVKHVGSDFLAKVLEISDMVVPNRAERDMIAEKLNIRQEFAGWCLDRGCRLVIVKMGRKGVEAWTGSRHYRVPAYKVECRDGTGAGDSFAGGLIYGMVRGLEVEECLRIANACGSITTTFMKPHGDFGIEDVMDIINHGEEDV
jgi:sugar/nucleoside kinase (ribokinase family)